MHSRISLSLSLYRNCSLKTIYFQLQDLLRIHEKAQERTVKNERLDVKVVYFNYRRKEKKEPCPLLHLLLLLVSFEPIEYLALSMRPAFIFFSSLQCCSFFVNQITTWTFTGKTSSSGRKAQKRTPKNERIDKKDRVQARVNIWHHASWGSTFPFSFSE